MKSFWCSPPGNTFTFMQSTCTTFPTSSFFTYFRLLSIPVENFIALWPPPRFSVGKAVSIRYIQSVMPLTTKTVGYLSSACLANHTHQQKAFIYCFPPEDIGWIKSGWFSSRPSSRSLFCLTFVHAVVDFQ